MRLEVGEEYHNAPLGVDDRLILADLRNARRRPRRVTTVDQSGSVSLNGFKYFRVSVPVCVVGGPFVEHQKIAGIDDRLKVRLLNLPRSPSTALGRPRDATDAAHDKATFRDLYRRTIQEADARIFRKIAAIVVVPGDASNPCEPLRERIPNRRYGAIAAAFSSRKRRKQVPCEEDAEALGPGNRPAVAEFLKKLGHSEAKETVCPGLGIGHHPLEIARQDQPGNTLGRMPKARTMPDVHRQFRVLGAAAPCGSSVPQRRNRRPLWCFHAKAHCPLRAKGLADDYENSINPVLFVADLLALSPMEPLPLKFYVYSRAMIEAIEPHEEPHLMISVTSAPTDQARLRRSPMRRGVLRLSFLDADAPTAEMPEEQLFSQEQAAAVWSFVANRAC